MEELQSSEILEREILEDARKKASRILKTADDTVNAKNAEWGKKTKDLINDLEARHNGQNKLAEEKLMARLPVDKLRARIEKIEDLLHFSVESWYHNLSKDYIHELLKYELKERIDFHEEILSSENINVYYTALDPSNVESILKNYFKNYSMEKSPGSGYFPSITLETENVRITASIQDVINFYLQEKREELIEAMIGSGLSEDS